MPVKIRQIFLLGGDALQPDQHHKDEECGNRDSQFEVSVCDDIDGLNICEESDRLRSLVDLEHVD